MEHQRINDSTQPPFEGVAITVGGRTLVLPPLSFGYMRKNPNKLIGLATAKDVTEIMGDMVEIAHAALRRNYPDMTVDEVDDLLDYNTSKVVFAALKRASGAVPGEAQPGTETVSP